MRRILITGPESTGKSDLSHWLSQHYSGKAVPEYARTYLEDLSRPYTYEDIEQIALQQKAEYEQPVPEEGWIFHDTWLLITKVWFEEVYRRTPSWLDRVLVEADFQMVLLCAPDIPWEPDPLRENGGERRMELFQRYQDELERLNWPWELVTGTGEARRRGALDILNRKFNI